MSIRSVKRFFLSTNSSKKIVSNRGDQLVYWVNDFLTYRIALTSLWLIGFNSVELSIIYLILNEQSDSLESVLYCSMCIETEQQKKFFFANICSEIVQKNCSKSVLIILFKRKYKFLKLKKNKVFFHCKGKEIC